MRALPVYLLIGACGFLTSCALFDSLPSAATRNSLDDQAVEFMRNTPAVDLRAFADQALRPDRQQKDVEVMVAVSGGGVRAAAFTLGVLTELENLGLWTAQASETNALVEIDHFSAVSGGAWGVAAYMADKHFYSGDEPYSLVENIDSIRTRFESYQVVRGKQGNPWRTQCLPTHLERIITVGEKTLKVGDVLKQAEEPPTLPTLLINATIQGDQSPFVFTQEFVDYYRVERFGFCGAKGEWVNADGFPGLNLAGPISTTGSVPGFYHSIAESRICDPGSDMANSYFCSQGKTSPYKYLVLVDGGLYDNYGYLTALEALRSARGNRRKVLIVIDSNADSPIPFTQEKEVRDLGLLAEAGGKAGFDARTAVFNRSLRAHAEAQNVDVVVLDFFGAASFSKKQAASHKDLLAGLDALRTYAAEQVDCFSDEGYFPAQEAGRTSADCRDNNFYRTGLLHKTTYLYDREFSLIREQLGRLVVRANADAIHAAVFGDR